METIRHIVYDIDKSSERMDEILNAGDKEFSDLPNILPRADLTYANGAYVNIAALFIDFGVYGYYEWARYMQGD